MAFSWTQVKIAIESGADNISFVHYCVAIYLQKKSSMTACITLMAVEAEK